MGKINALSGIIGQRETAIIGAVVDEITAKPVESLGLQLMPVKAYPQHLIYHDKVSGFGGLLSERVIGEEGGSGSASSAQTYEFGPGAYQESIRFNERDLIALRRLGSMGERGATGVTAGALDFMGRAGENLRVKLLNRMNKMAWDTILTGKYTYLGVTKHDFLPPAGNTITAATDWSVTGTSTPLKDLLVILKQNPVYFKYIIKELVINPVTEAAILNSAEVRAVVTNNAAAVGDINVARQILYPGLPPFRVCKDAYQPQTVGADGQISHGNAVYFVPDYYVLSIPDFSGLLYGLYGEIQLTYNMNDPAATVENPAMGIYTFVDENGLMKRKSPYVEIVTGFNGGANLMRSNDVLIIKGKTGI